MYCKKCGTQISDTAAFCKGCGVKIERSAPKEKQPERPVCPGCGCEVREGARFCKRCGTALSSVQTMGGSAPSKVTRVQPAEQTQPVCTLPDYSAATESPQRGGATSDILSMLKQKPIIGVLIGAVCVVLLVTLVPWSDIFGGGDEFGDVVSPYSQGYSAEVTPVKNEYGESVSEQDGQLSMNGTVVRVGGGMEQPAVMRQVENTRFEQDNGLCSPLYEVELDGASTEPMLVSFPFPEGITAGESSQIMIGIGRDYAGDDGKCYRQYRYCDADFDGDRVAVSIPVSEYSSDEASYLGFSMGMNAVDSKGTIKYYIGMFENDGIFYENGHFELYFPSRMTLKKTFDMETSKAVLDDLETMYEFYKERGYDVESCGTQELYIKYGLGQDGTYDGLSGDISLSSALFEKGYSRDTVLTTLYHEYFHAIQDNYVNFFTDNLWFSEATAMYYEALYKDITHTTHSDAELPRQLQSLLPVGERNRRKTTNDGYARLPLIITICREQGSDEWIRDAYKNGEIGDEYINKYVDKPSFAEGFYFKLMATDLSSTRPLDAFKYAGIGIFGRNGSKLILTVPKIKKNEDGSIEPVVLGSGTTTLNGRGAWMISLRCDKKELKKLPDGEDAVVTGEGCSVQVIRVKSGDDNWFEKLDNDTIDKVTIKSLKESCLETQGTYYLILAVSSENDKDVESEVSVTVTLGNKELPMAELVGTYEMTHVEGEDSATEVVEFFIEGDKLATDMAEGIEEDFVCFESYDPKTGKAVLRHIGSDEDGEYLLCMDITFVRTGETIGFTGTAGSEQGGERLEDYKIYGEKSYS